METLASTTANGDNRRVSLPVFPATRKSAVDVIWNMTLLCPHDCAVCCVDAQHVRRSGDKIIIRTHGLTEEIVIDAVEGVSIFEQAKKALVAQSHELDFPGKLQVLDHLEGYQVKIDISGGDPLTLRENYELMMIAASRFGRTGVTLTATGAGLGGYCVEDVAPFISEYNFTFDGVPGHIGGNRPVNYAAGNLAMASRFARHGVKTRGETPLTLTNCSERVLTQIYLGLHQAGIDTMLLMRLFRSGRGQSPSIAAQVPTRADYVRAIAVARDLEQKYGSPKVKLQCALKHLDGVDGPMNPCDMVHESFGLMADGTLLASPWAIDAFGRPAGPEWVLGNLATTSLSSILDSERVRTMRSRLEENRGHCKIWAAMNSTASNPADRMFDWSDPLYI